TPAREFSRIEKKVPCSALRGHPAIPVAVRDPPDGRTYRDRLTSCVGRPASRSRSMAVPHRASACESSRSTILILTSVSILGRILCRGRGGVKGESRSRRPPGERRDWRSCRDGVWRASPGRQVVWTKISEPVLGPHEVEQTVARSPMARLRQADQRNWAQDIAVAMLRLRDRVAIARGPDELTVEENDLVRVTEDVDAILQIP